MAVITGMIVTFSLIVYAILNGIFVGYPLFTGLLIFSLISIHKGYTIKEVALMAYKGGKKAFIVLKILLLIGAVTSLWMAAGTVPGIVYYGIQFMNPQWYILYAFLISAFVSLLLGSSLGTVSTVGIALIVMAKSGHVNPNIAAGAIMSGAYFGDRCSPMSSSAHLVANLTSTPIYNNIKNMLKTAIIPLLLTFLLFVLVSFLQPLQFSDSGITENLLNTFTINWYVLLPAFTIILLSLLKVNIKIAMFLSILVAASISIIIQHTGIYEIFITLIMGFKLPSEHPLFLIIKGGGILSMWKACFVVFVSCLLAGLFEGTKMLKSVEPLLLTGQTRSDIFLRTIFVSFITGALGCNQSITIVLTNQLMTDVYKKKQLTPDQLAIDIENTGVLIAAIIPWNIAAFVPTSTLGVSSTAYIPYAFFIYLVPIISWVYHRTVSNRHQVL